MIALLLAIALVWPTGSASPATEAYLLRQAQAAHPGPDLILFPGLDRLAGKRAVEVSSSFRHVQFWTRLASYGLRDRLQACEIIGWNNYPDDLSAAAVWRAFMASGTHHDCIVWPGYDAIGVGSYKLADGRKFYAILFTDQVERRITSAGKWLRTRTGHRLAWLPHGTRLVVFNHRYDSVGRLHLYVWALGRYGWLTTWGTKLI